MKQLLRPWLIILLCSLCLPALLQAQTTVNKNVAAPQAKVQPGRLVFKLKPQFAGVSPTDARALPALAAALRSMGAQQVRQKFPRTKLPSTERPGGVNLRLVYQLELGPGVALEKARQALEQTEAVQYAEPLYQRFPMYQPNDPYSDSTRVNTRQYYLKKIQAYRAWDVTKGDTNVVIGIADGGTRLTHEDLAAQVKHNYADPIDGIDNDLDGYVDNFNGWDMADNDSNPIREPNSVHGILVAGCAAAHADNGRGIAGVGFKCKFLPIKIYPSTAAGSFAGYEGVVYAADHGCQVINLSWGGVGGRSQFEQDVMTYAAINRDAVLVAAAGNTNAELDFYPASYDHVISVAALEPNDVKGSSNTYSYHVDLSAPGQQILTTFGNTDTDYLSVGGSSFSAPLVAGAAALVRVQFPTYNAAQVAAQLRQTTDDIYSIPANANYLNKLGTGRLNVHHALIRLDEREARVVQSQFAPARPAYAPGDTVRITAVVQNLLLPVTNLTVTITSLTPHITVLQNHFAVGALGTLDSATNAAVPFRLVVANVVPLNTKATLRYHFTADNGYEDDQFVSLVLNPDYVVLNAGDLALTLTSRGNLGYDGLDLAKGESVTYRQGPPLLYEGGLMVATTPTRVSDRVRNDRNGADADFFSLSQILLQEQPLRADQEALGIFQDSLPTATRNRTVGVRIRQQGYAWANAAQRDYVVVEYQLTNITSDTLRPLYAGLFMDWDLAPAASRNAAAWDSAQAMGYVYDPLAPNLYMGVKLLRGGEPACYSINNSAPVGTPVWMTDGFSSAEKFLTLSNGTQQRTAGLPTGADISQVVGAALELLAPGDSVTVAFAVLGATSLPALQTAATTAQTRYETVVLPTKKSNVVAWHVYPNPATDQVHLWVPAAFGAQEVKLVNALGQVVHQQRMGRTGLDIPVRNLAAGVYLVRVQGAGGLLTQRLVIQ